MAAPTFYFAQLTTSWASGTATEFSTTSGAGAALGSISGNMNFSNNSGATGAQSSNTWSATYPVPVGSNSYEFIFALYVKTPADNSLTNMKVWVPSFSAITGVTFFAGSISASSFATAVTTNSTKATTNFTAINDQSSAFISVWPPYNYANCLSHPCYFQARTTGSASGGNQSVMPTISISLDWS